MRHAIVTRVTLALSLLFVAVAVMFAWLVTPRETMAVVPKIEAQPPAKGAALFAEHCGACHAAGDLRLAEGTGLDVWRRERIEFLASHGEASAEDDAAILDYLSVIE